MGQVLCESTTPDHDAAQASDLTQQGAVIDKKMHQNVLSSDIKEYDTAVQAQMVAILYISNTFPPNTVLFCTKL